MGLVTGADAARLGGSNVAGVAWPQWLIAPEEECLKVAPMAARALMYVSLMALSYSAFSLGRATTLGYLTHSVNHLLSKAQPVEASRALVIGLAHRASLERPEGWGPQRMPIPCDAGTRRGDRDDHDQG